MWLLALLKLLTLHVFLLDSSPLSKQEVYVISQTVLSLTSGKFNLLINYVYEGFSVHTLWEIKINSHS